MIYLKSIESTGAAFRCTFTHQDGAVVILDVAALALQRYAIFQHVVLEGLALMFCMPECEGQTDPIADKFWREQVAIMLNRSARKLEKPNDPMN